MPSSHLILCRPLLLLPPIPPSITVFSSESTLRMRWPNYWSFSFSIIPSKEIPGLISFRMDWLDLLAVQGTLKSLLQHHRSKASIFRRSAFFTVQLSHPYMTTGKTIALTRWTFVDKVMSLLLNMLSRLVITFLPRSKRLLISWLQSPSAVILEPKKIKSDTVSTVSPIRHVYTHKGGKDQGGHIYTHKRGKDQGGHMKLVGHHGEMQFAAGQWCSEIILPACIFKLCAGSLWSFLILWAVFLCICGLRLTGYWLCPWVHPNPMRSGTDCIYQ